MRQFMLVGGIALGAWGAACIVERLECWLLPIMRRALPGLL